MIRWNDNYITGIEKLDKWKSCIRRRCYTVFNFFVCQIPVK